jgi:uncharacterized Zn finger protein
MNWGFEWRPYTSVAQKKNQATQHAAQVAKSQKRAPAPVVLQGRQIAKTFWGKAWCDNLTSYQDYSNRLPRGATYLRNGSVVDLVIKTKKIEAIVAGSEPYEISIKITELDKKRWKAIRTDCSESIDSLLDLLSGKLSDGVMKRLTDQKTGLFPAPREIQMSCSCPDYSSCCKHLAAVMYGIGTRLDSKPELLFLLRGVDHQELVSQAIAAGNLDRELASADSGLGSQDLGAIFGIELETSTAGASKPKGKGSSEGKPVTAAAPPRSVKSVAAKKTATKAKAAKKTPAAEAVKKSGSVTKSRSAVKSVKSKPAAKTNPVDAASRSGNSPAKHRSKATGHRSKSAVKPAEKKSSR